MNKQQICSLSASQRQPATQQQLCNPSAAAKVKPQQSTATVTANSTAP